MRKTGIGKDGNRKSEIGWEVVVSVKSLETLEVWKKAKEFALRIYREVLPLLPPEEKWNLNQ